MMPNTLRRGHEGTRREELMVTARKEIAGQVVPSSTWGMSVSERMTRRFQSSVTMLT